MPASWHSEPFPAGGGITAEGVRNQLGRPQLSRFEVLAREAIQNSWDARDGDAVVSFRIDGIECDPENRRRIASLVGRDAPTEGLALDEALRRNPLRLLAISDRGTTGLGGPTRADIHPNDDIPRDFVAFIRNVGEPRDKDLGAGTFGFGKTIFYLVSRARTIIVYTRCKSHGPYESRLIGCAVGESFTRRTVGGHRPYTGRHWWGVSRDGVHEPLLDAQADECASALGLDPFAPTETGTSIVIVDPDFNHPEEDIRALACAITWHAWPKMIAETLTMTFAVTWRGEPVDIPDPERTPPLDAFVNAYRRLNTSETVECNRPPKLLGRLALHRDLVRAQRPDYPPSFEPPIDSPVHHVALLRAPHFVVKYFPGDALPGDIAEYAGVFEANREIDDVFARAEPPTHDDWVTKQLRGQERTWMNTTFRRLTERLRAFARPVGIEIVAGGAVPLAAASAQFASLVGTAPSLGSGRLSPTEGSDQGGRNRGSGRGGVGGGGRRPGSIEEVGMAEHGGFDDMPALLFPFRIRRAEPGAYVSAEIAVAVDESLTQERERPAGSATLSVMGWVGPAGEHVRSQRLEADGRVGELWRLAVRPVEDTATRVSLKVVDE